MKKYRNFLLLSLISLCCINSNMNNMKIIHVTNNMITKRQAVTNEIETDFGVSNGDIVESNYVAHWTEDYDGLVLDYNLNSNPINCVYEITVFRALNFINGEIKTGICFSVDFDNFNCDYTVTKIYTEGDSFTVTGGISFKSPVVDAEVSSGITTGTSNSTWVTVCYDLDEYESGTHTYRVDICGIACLGIITRYNSSGAYIDSTYIAEIPFTTVAKVIEL